MMKKKLIAGLIAASLFGVAAVGCAKTAPVDNRVKDLFGSYDRGDNIVGDTNAYADPNVTVDGELSEQLWTNAVWNDMKSEEANRTGTNVGNNVADCNISATAVVRDNGLYVGIKSADTVAYAGKILAVNDKTILSAFAQTGVSLYFSDTVDLIAGDPCHEIGFSVAGTVRYIFHNAGGRYERNLRNAKIKTKIDGDINTSSINGYTIEVYIPWTELGYAENTYAESIMATFGSHRHPAFENAESYDGKKLTFEMLELQRGASWLKPLTWTEYGENGKTDGGVTESDKYGDYSATLTANAKALYPQSSAFISASGGQQYSYVKNVHGNNLYAEAVVKNVNTNWGYVGFAFRDVQTPPTYTQTGAQFTETDNGAVWAGLRYGGGDIGNHLYMISSDLSDVGDVSKTGNKSYAIGVKETYDNSKNSTGVKIGAYISDSGTVLIYVNGELKKTGYAKHLAGKDLCASFAARDASCFYGDISVLTGDAAKEKVKDDLSGLESAIYGDYSETIKADATAVYGANGDLTLNKTNGQQYLYVKNKVDKKLYAKATISNVNVNWGVIGFAFRDPTDLTKSVWMGLRYGAELLTNHCYVISPNLADVGSDKGGNVFVGGTQGTFDNSKGDTGVTVEAMIDDDGTAIIAINGVVKKYVKLDAFANKDLIMSVAGRDCSATLKNTEYLAANEAAAKITAYKASAISDVYGDYSETIKADATAIYGANGDLTLNKTNGQQYLYVKNKVGKKLYAKATISNVNVNWGVIGFAFRDPTDLVKSVWMGLRYAGADKSLHLYVISTNLDDVGDTYKDGNKTYAFGTAETFDNSKGDTGVTVEAMIDDDGTAIIAINGEIKKFVKLDALANKDLIMSVAGANCGAEFKNTEYLAANEAAAKVTAYKSTVISDVYGDYSETIKADATAIYGSNGDLTLNKTSGQQYLYVKNKVGKKLYAKATISNVNVNHGVVGFAFRDPTDLTKSVWMGLRYAGDNKSLHLYVISTNLDDVGKPDAEGNTYVVGTAETFDNSKGATGVTLEAYIDESGNVIVGVDGKFVQSARLTAFADKDMIVAVAGRDCAAEYKNVSVKTGEAAFQAINDSYATDGDTFTAKNIDGVYQNGVNLSGDIANAAHPSVEITVPSNGDRYTTYKSEINSNKLFAQYTIKSFGTVTSNTWGQVSLAFVNADGKVTYYGVKYQQTASAATNIAAIASYYTENNQIIAWSDTDKDNGTKGIYHMTYERAGFPNDGGMLDKFNDKGLTFTVYCDGAKYYYFLNGIPIAGGNKGYNERSIADNTNDFGGVGTSVIVKALIVAQNVHVTFSDYNIAIGDNAATSYNAFLNTLSGDTFTAKNIDGVYQTGVDLRGDIASAAHPSIEITVPYNGQRYATYNGVIDSNKIFAQYTIKSLGTKTNNKNGAVSLAFVNADGNVTYYGLQCVQSDNAATSVSRIASYYTQNNKIIAWASTDNGAETKDVNWMTYANAGFPGDSGMLNNLNGDGLTFTVYCDGTKYYYYLNGVPIAGWHGSYTRSLVTADQNFNTVGTSNIVKALIVVENAHVAFSDYKIAVGDNAVTSFNAFAGDFDKGKYGDYSETIKANATATYGANNYMVLNKTSKQQYLYVKNTVGKKLYAKATISNVNVNWGFVGFAFRDVQIPPTYSADNNETDNGAVWVGLRYGGTDGNKYTNHLYMISSNLEDVGSNSMSGNYNVNSTQETFDNSKGDTGVTVEAYIDETGKVTLYIDGVKKTEQTISHLAGKDMIVSFACRDARACYRDISIKIGDEATTAFNALTK